MMIHLKHSKTDPLEGWIHVVFRLYTGGEFCLITAMLGYLARRPRDPGFLFLFQVGTLCQELVFVMRAAAGSYDCWGRHYRVQWPVFALELQQQPHK